MIRFFRAYDKETQGFSSPKPMSDTVRFQKQAEVLILRRETGLMFPILRKSLLKSGTGVLPKIHRYNLYGYVNINLEAFKASGLRHVLVEVDDEGNMRPAWLRDR